MRVLDPDGVKRSTHKNSRKAEQGFWTLVHLFREECPYGWSLERIVFASRKHTIKGGGKRWTMSCSIEVDMRNGVPEVVVSLDTDRPEGRSFTQDCTPRLLAFARRVDRTMRRAGYSGWIRADGVLGTKWSGYFWKMLPAGAKAILGEFRVLGNLKLGASGTRRRATS